jgi:signal transduction histidine kinase
MRPMNSRSGSNGSPPRPMARHLMGLQAAWLLFLIVLGAWWVSLMLSQAGRIATLEQQTGITAVDAHRQWVRTQRMLFWEGGTFFAFLVLSLGGIAGLHWRDNRRARTLQAFFASVTHELRTPLAALRLESEGLAEILPSTHPGRPLVERMLEDSARLESQVERALELARLEGGGGVITRAVNLRPLVAECLRTWRPPPGRTIEIRNHVDDVGAMSDPASFQTLLRNLLENSARHARANPVLITLTSQATETTTTLVIADQGGPAAGLPVQMGVLFARGSESGGAGVGLYLTRQLMQRMGGDARFHAGPEGFRTELTFRSEVSGG